MSSWGDAQVAKFNKPQKMILKKLNITVFFTCKKGLQNDFDKTIKEAQIY
jgi:hypothetical protein